MSNLTRKQHLNAAIESSKKAKVLRDHIAHLGGDAFGLRLQVVKLEEKAAWHLDYAEALRKNVSQFMWSIV